MEHRILRQPWKRASSCLFSRQLVVHPIPRSTNALASADQRNQPSLQPLHVLRLVDLICHLWQQYVTDAIFPLASTSVTVRRDMVVFNNQAVSRIEGAANGFLQRMIDCRFPPSSFSPPHLLFALSKQLSLGFLLSCLSKRGMILRHGMMTSPSRALTLSRVLRVGRCWKRSGTLRGNARVERIWRSY